MHTPIAASVRRARLSDTAAVTALVNRAYEIESAFVEGDRTSESEVASLIRSGGFLVLECAGGIAATVLFFGPGGSGSGRDGVPASHAYFGMLSVRPELQGMGLGRRLVQVVEALAEATGATSMSLRVINLREELGRWYKSLGYRVIGTTPYNHRCVKRPCHFIEMAKPLGGTARYSESAGNEVGAA